MLDSRGGSRGQARGQVAKCLLASSWVRQGHFVLLEIGQLLQQIMIAVGQLLVLSLQLHHLSLHIVQCHPVLLSFIVVCISCFHALRFQWRDIGSRHIGTLFDVVKKRILFLFQVLELLFQTLFVFTIGGWRLMSSFLARFHFFKLLSQVLIFFQSFFRPLLGVSELLLFESELPLVIALLGVHSGRVTRGFTWSSDHFLRDWQRVTLVEIKNAPFTESFVSLELLQTFSLHFYFVWKLPHQGWLAALVLKCETGRRGSLGLIGLLLG